MRPWATLSGRWYGEGPISAAYGKARLLFGIRGMDHG